MGKAAAHTSGRGWIDLLAGGLLLLLASRPDIDTRTLRLLGPDHLRGRVDTPMEILRRAGHFEGTDGSVRPRPDGRADIS